MNSMQKRLGNMNKNVSALVECLIWFSCGIVVISPLLGTLFEFAGLKWGWFPFTLIILASAAVAVIMRNKQIFFIESWYELLFFILFLLGLVFIYGQYSPILEIRQDPAVYLMKALNLLNYGHTYAPAGTIQELVEQGVLSAKMVTESSALQNGTMYLDGKWFTDFYPGGAFFYAMIGQVSKLLIFYAPSMLMAGNGVLMFFAVKRLTASQSMISRTLLTAAFYVAPVIVWFGRGTYTEPAALFLTLLLINLLLSEEAPVWVLITVFLGAYTTRIDYLLILLLGIFIITYMNRLAGGIFTLAAVTEVLIFKNVYWIYYNRITTEDMPVLKYGFVLLLLAFVISFIIAGWGRELFEKVYYSKAVKVIIIFIGFGCTLLMYRDNIVAPENYQTAIIHERNLMTYAEHIWDLLFLVFPSVILLIGILCIYQFIHKKGIPLLASVFLLGSIGVYLYFFLAAGNSPQLYWMLRRYYNIILPVAFLSFVIFVEGMSKKTGLIISTACFMLSLNLFLNSGQIPNYKGMDKSVEAMDQALSERNVSRIFYDEDIRYEISSLLSYSDAEFIPIPSAAKDEFAAWAQGQDMEGAVWITNEDYGSEREEYGFEFSRMGENYGEVPKDVYHEAYRFFVYPLEDFINIKELTKNVVYPNIRVTDVQGFYDDGQWTGGQLEICTGDMKTDGYGKLEVELYDYAHYWLDRGELEKQKIVMRINDNIELKPLEYKDHKVIFDISGINIGIRKLSMTMATIIPEEAGIAQDTRELGLAVKKIVMQ